MKKSVICLAVCAVASVAFSQQSVTNAAGAAKQRIRGAGYAIRPGTKPGSIAILNAQTTVSSAEFKRLSKDFESQLDINVPITNVPAPKDKDDIARIFKDSKANFGVVVVDFAESENGIAIYPDQRYAVVNINALRGKGGEALPFLKARTRKQVIRAFIMVAGGSSSMNGKNLMSPVNDITDLDKIVIEDMPTDVLARMSRYLPDAGCNRVVKVPYVKACREGWAPAPTNDAQRAVWDRVHAIPDKPMKIEFDPATQKGKVTK